MPRARSAALLAALLVTGCASPPPPPAEPSFTPADEAAMDAVVAAAMEIANGSKDWDAYVQTYYAADATILPANSPAIQGHAAIAEFLRGFPTMTAFSSQKVDAGGDGDLAYVYGRYHMEMEGEGGPMVDDGKYVEVWKRQADGGWKVVYDIFNTDMPAM